MLKDITVPLYTALVRLDMEYCMQFWGAPFEKDVSRMEQLQKRATRKIRGLEIKSYEE